MEELSPYISQFEECRSEELQFLKVSGQTGYAAAVTPASDYLTKEAAAENIFTSWLSNHTLWDKIRTSGGAYGANPTPAKSIDVYLQSLKELCSKPIPQEEVEKTIVSSYGNAIVPACPKDRGARSFEGMLYANPQSFKQLRLDNILEVREDDVEMACDRLYEASLKKCTKAVFSSKSEKTALNNIRIPL